MRLAAATPNVSLNRRITQRSPPENAVAADRELTRRTTNSAFSEASIRAYRFRVKSRGPSEFRCSTFKFGDS
jgi:hypothetical protein